MMQTASMSKSQGFQEFQQIQFIMKQVQEVKKNQEKFTTKERLHKLKLAFRNEDYFSMNKSRTRHDVNFAYLKFHNLI